MKLFKPQIDQEKNKRFKQLLNLKSKRFKLMNFILMSKILRGFRDQIWCYRILNSHTFKIAICNSNSFRMLLYSNNSFKMLICNSNNFNIQIISLKI